MEHALTSQLDTSNNHLLKTLSDALYSANFLSIRCVKSSDDFWFSDEFSDAGVHGRRYRSLCCVIGGARCLVAVEMGAVTKGLALMYRAPWSSMGIVRDDYSVGKTVLDAQKQSNGEAESTKLYRLNK